LGLGQIKYMLSTLKQREGFHAFTSMMNTQRQLVSFKVMSSFFLIYMAFCEIHLFLNAHAGVLINYNKKNITTNQSELQVFLYLELKHWYNQQALNKQYYLIKRLIIFSEFAETIKVVFEINASPTYDI